MNRIVEEIFIRTISGVLVVVIVFIIFELVSRMRKPCACKGNPDTKDLPGGEPMADQEQPRSFIYNPFGTNFG